LINQRRNIEAQWTKPTFQDGILHGSEISNPAHFTERRQDKDLSLTQPIKGVGKLVTEKMLQASKDEQEYFKRTHKIFTKEALKDTVYKRQIPEYLRLMEDPSNSTRLTAFL